MSKRITKRDVDALKAGTIIWDAEIKGFGVRARATGAKYFVLKYRSGQRQRWYTIGRYASPWTVEKARKKASKLLGSVADDKDPATRRESDEKAPRDVSGCVTAFVEHAKATRADSTARLYENLLVRLVVPKLGSLKVPDVTHGDIARLHSSLKKTPFQANRVVAVLSKMFSWAGKQDFGFEIDNPCVGIDKNPEPARERFLSDIELVRLGTTLAEAEAGDDESVYAIAAIRLLLFTGTRLNEILTLKQEFVDIERSVLRLPRTKTGPRTIFLPAPAKEVLANLPSVQGNPYVIVGHKEGRHLVNLNKVWRRIRDKAKLPDVRIHDLRHSFASTAAGGGLSLPVIGALLGHTQAQTIQRYAHLADDPIRAAAEATAGRIAAIMAGKPKAKVRKIR